MYEKLKAGGASDREKVQRGYYLIAHKHHDGTQRQLWQTRLPKECVICARTHFAQERILYVRGVAIEISLVH